MKEGNVEEEKIKSCKNSCWTDRRNRKNVGTAEVTGVIAVALRALLFCMRLKKDKTKKQKLNESQLDYTWVETLV